VTDNPGEVYFLGELELGGAARTPFVKIGLVRSNAKNRTTEDRLTEHQTGNPRQIVELAVLKTAEADRVETLLHKSFAPWRVSGEWFDLQNDRLDEVLAEGERIVSLVSAESDLQAQAKALEVVPSEGEKLPASPTSQEAAMRAVISKRGLKLIGETEDRVVAALITASRAGRDVTRYLAVQVKDKAATFDTTRFKKDHPDLYASLATSKTSWSKTFVTAKMTDLGLDDAALDPELRDLCDRIDSAAAAVETSGPPSGLHELYLELLHFDARYDLELRAAEAQLKVLCGTAPGIEGLCTWNRRENTGLSFDKDALRDQQPELYAEYEKPATTSESHVLAKDSGYRSYP
jgi:hypothetical protein